MLISIPAAFIVSGLGGIGIERGVIRFLYGRPLETLLATFGISLILQQLVRTLISPQNVPVSNPEFMSGFWQVNSVLSRKSWSCPRLVDGWVWSATASSATTRP